MQETLFDSRLADRDFGSHVLHIPALLDWVKAKGLHLPVTQPALDGYKFVQVEALLAAISRPLHSLTPEQALNLALSNPELKDHEAVGGKDGMAARWLLGADAHLRWEKLIGAAVQSGELVLLDFASKLPIAASALPGQETAPAAVQPAPNKAGWDAARSPGIQTLHLIRIPAGAPFVLAEMIPVWIADALVPIPDVAPSVLSLRKQISIGKPAEFELVSLTAEDWALLDRIWHDHSTATHTKPMNANYEQFYEYREVFESSPEKPAWDLHAEFSNPKYDAEVRQINIKHRHTQDLSAAAASGQITILTAQRTPTNRIEPGSIVSVEDARRYLEPLGFELVPDQVSRTPAKLFGEGFSAEMQQQTTLTKYLALETWTPLLACLLVSGFQPNIDVSEFPTDGILGLDNCFNLVNERLFVPVRLVLTRWNSREVAPAKVRPAEFIKWCQSQKDINTDWLREVPLDQVGPVSSASTMQGVSPVNKPAEPGWKMQVQNEAAALWLRVIATGGTPKVWNIKDQMAAWCRANNVTTDGTTFPKAGYLRTHVLSPKYWKPPS